MKPKQQIDPNAAGLEASRLFATDEKERMTLKNMRSVKVARKEQLKAALTIVWAAFESGQTVNGFATRKEWCKEFAKVSARTCENILYGRAERKANHGSLLTRIADVKKKLTDIQSQIDAYFNAPDGAEPETDISGLTASITPTIEPLFEEFLKLITPDGCETMRIGNSNWHVQAYGKKPAPILHIKHSARKALCHTRFVNRPRKGTVFAKAGEEATCPDCIAIRDKVPVKGTLQEARERALAKEQEAQPEETSIKIKLTDSQMREAGVVITPLSNAKKLTRSARAVSFDASTYQEVGKELILALEQRVESLRVEADEQKKTLLTWTDKSPENVAAFTQQKRLLGAVRACEGAISRIVNGGDDTEDNLYDWYEQHRDERLGISESAQALAAATEAAADMPSNIAPEILETIKHQKARIALGLHPTNDECPNEDDEDEEEFEDETEENSEEEVQ